MTPTPRGQHTLKVDDDVWNAIETLARPFVDKTPNDFLRRVLIAEAKQPSARPAPARKPGALAGAIERGTIKPGDVLLCEQPRRKRTFRAEVTVDGWIKLTTPDLGEYDKPSPALVACTGGQINGWGNWVHEDSGRPLQDFRY